MDFKIKTDGSPDARVYTARPLSSASPLLVGRTGATGESAELLADDTVVGRISYGPRTPAGELLRPRSIDPDSSVSFELRNVAGVVYQPNSAIVGARRRAIHVEHGDSRYQLWKPLGRLVLSSRQSQDTELHWRRSFATTPDQVSLEVLLLLLTGQVTRHLSALTM